MKHRLNVAWVAGGNLGSSRALGRVTGSCVSFMLYFPTAGWDGGECAVQGLAVLQKEQSGSCVLMSVVCLVLCLNGASD